MREFTKIDDTMARELGCKKYRKTALATAVQMQEPFLCQTTEGPLEGKPGDWLMVDAEGNTYPCSAAVFAATYELAE
jgi:hypothetical protein